MGTPSYVSTEEKPHYNAKSNRTCHNMIMKLHAIKMVCRQYEHAWTLWVCMEATEKYFSEVPFLVD